MMSTLSEVVCSFAIKGNVNRDLFISEPCYDWRKGSGRNWVTNKTFKVSSWRFPLLTFIVLASNTSCFILRFDEIHQQLYESQLCSLNSISRKCTKHTKIKKREVDDNNKNSRVFFYFVNLAISCGTHTSVHAHTHNGNGTFIWGSVGRRRSNWLRESFVSHIFCVYRARGLYRTIASRITQHPVGWLIQPALFPPSSFDIRSCLCIFHHIFFSLVWEILKIIISFQLFFFPSSLVKMRSKRQKLLPKKKNTENIAFNTLEELRIGCEAKVFASLTRGHPAIKNCTMMIVTWCRAVNPSTLAVSMSAPPLLSMLRTSSLSPAAQAARKMHPAENLTFRALAFFGNTDSRLVSESSYRLSCSTRFEKAVLFRAISISFTNFSFLIFSFAFF